MNKKYFKSSYVVIFLSVVVWERQTGVCPSQQITRKPGLLSSVQCGWMGRGIKASDSNITLTLLRLEYADVSMFPASITAINLMCSNTIYKKVIEEILISSETDGIWDRIRSCFCVWYSSRLVYYSPGDVLLFLLIDADLKYISLVSLVWPEV